VLTGGCLFLILQTYVAIMLYTLLDNDTFVQF